MSLKSTVEYALNHSPVFSSSKVQRALADLDVSDRRSAFLPSLDIDSSIGLSTGFKGKTTYSEEPVTSQLNLKLTETLYDNGKSYTLLNKSRASRDISELTLKKDRDSLCLEVTQLLYDYSSTQKLAIAKKEQYDLIQKQFTDAGNQYKGGLRTRRDFLRFKTEAQRAELEKRTAENNTEKLISTLRKLIGDDQNQVEFAIVEVNSLPHITPAKPTEIQQTYEYRLTQLSAKLSDYDLYIAKRSYWPNLNLSAGASYNNAQFVNSNRSFRDTETYNANVGLVLSFNIWDWGTRNRAVERAESQVLLSEYSVKTKELELKEELKNLFLDLETYKSTYSLSQELLNAQEDAYKIIRRDYQDGEAKYTDLIDSLAKLLDAKTSFLQSRYRLASALAKNLYYEGKIYETLPK